MAFCFVQGMVGHFSSAAPATHSRRYGENKNEKLYPCGENDFLPARLAFFHTAPPGPINTGNHRFSLRVHRSTLISVATSCALKSAGLFSFFSFIFTYFFLHLASLKNQFGVPYNIYRYPIYNIIYIGHNVFYRIKCYIMLPHFHYFNHHIKNLYYVYTFIIIIDFIFILLPF